MQTLQWCNVWKKSNLAFDFFLLINLFFFGKWSRLKLTGITFSLFFPSSFFFSPPARTTSCSPCRRGFEGGHKSILAVLLAINCALKFYSVFMICRQRVIYVDAWVTPSNCCCFPEPRDPRPTSRLKLPRRLEPGLVTHVQTRDGLTLQHSQEEKKKKIDVGGKKIKIKNASRPRRQRRGKHTQLFFTYVRARIASCGAAVCHRASHAMNVQCVSA